MTRPQWLRKKAPPPGVLTELEELFHNLSLNTVCREANCPNVGECFGRKTATFLILGAVCTRQCPFCNVTKGVPEPVNYAEPDQVAEAVARLDLKHVVITSVTRDDLPDGGAGHFAATIRAVKARNQGTTVEVLIPDFQGDLEALQAVVAAKPEVIGHNLETVPSLYPSVRPRANYQRSLDVLAKVKKLAPEIYTKSGIMVGLGERKEEVQAVLADLRGVGCDMVTIGQYLQPSVKHLPVVNFVHPREFEMWEKMATQMGFSYVASAPFVRSSYNAGAALRTLLEKKGGS